MGKDVIGKTDSLPNLSGFDEVIWFDFDVPNNRIDARTLSRINLQIADLIESVAKHFDTACQVQVFIEAFQDGSFKQKVVAVFKWANNDQSNLGKIVVGVIVAGLVYLIGCSSPKSGATPQTNQAPQVVINNTYIFNISNDVYQNTTVQQNVKGLFNHVYQDPNIKSFKVSTDNESWTNTISRADLEQALGKKAEPKKPSGKYRIKKH